MKKENWYKLLYICSGLLILGFCIGVAADYVRYDTMANSAPFYVFIMVRLLEFVLPSAILFIVAKVLKKKFN